MSLFRRNRDKGDHEPDERTGDKVGKPAVSEPRAADPSEPQPLARSGPLDFESWDGEGRTIDFGAILVPAVEGMQIRVETDGDTVVAVGVMLHETAMQLQAFAAPRGEGIWDEVRQEIAEGIRGSRGKARETDGPFGRELRADVVVASPEGAAGRQPVRFIGVDGPRWFLRGLISGAGGADPERAKAVEDVFERVVVRRGEHAAAPREQLPLQLPEDPGLVSEEPPGG